MSNEQPKGTFPLVFESGVLNVDKEGVLHVHLSHSPQSPHPMVTHPEGGESTIPPNESEAFIEGNQEETIVLRCGLKETETLPTGFTFHLKGWKLMQLEMSGDLTVVMSDLQDAPNWFQPGKIHRFDGPESGVRLYAGSESLKETAQKSPKAKASTTKPTPIETPRQSQQSTYRTPSKSGLGCAILFSIGVLSAGLSTLPFMS